MKVETVAFVVAYENEYESPSRIHYQSVIAPDKFCAIETVLTMGDAINVLSCVPYCNNDDEMTE